LKQPHDSCSGFWATRERDAEAAPEFDVKNETRVDRVVARICGGVAQNTAAKAGLPPALALGRQAAVLDPESLDVARIHEEALATLNLPAAMKECS